MVENLRVLFVEDSEDDMLLLARHFKGSDIKLSYRRVDTESEFRTALNEEQWDVILCDFSMPEFDAFTALRIFQESKLTIPFLVASGTIGEEQAVALMKAGINDYIMKDNLIRLIPAIKRELNDAENRKLKHLAEIRLLENEKKFRTLAENSLDYILRLDVDGNVIYANRNAIKKLDDSIEPVIGRSLRKINMLISTDDVENILVEIIGSWIALRKELISIIGEWIDWHFIPEFDVDNQITSIMAVGRDITERKRIEDELRYLTVHDPLTGLHNRVYLERQLHTIENNNSYPVGIIICDVDGLKMINDSLGHDQGNALLKEVAHLLRSSLPESSIIAREGGDEFSIVLSRTSKEDFKIAIESVYGAIETYNELYDKLPMSLSVGYAHTEGKQSVIETYREADNHMYRKKLHKTQSTRSGIVQLLIKALEVRDFETEKHMERMEELVVLMGNELQLSESKITDLRLFARFHDIGKVGIPDDILFKPGKLNDAEWETMKNHSEIGYRIARSAPELKHISEFILMHHEWWNGNGYPLGSRGEQIPLECRILAIADAYDAMTSDRPYRKGMDKELAIEELKIQRGHQFDPHIVDVFLSISLSKQL